MEKEFQRICFESSSDMCNAIKTCQDAQEIYLTATAPHNSHKNRYQDVLPLGFDGGLPTRVHLQRKFGIDGSDYINANHVDTTGVCGLRYIAAQAPVPHTIGDFWRMIWEQESSIIIMLTKLIENDRIKAHCYWPPASQTYIYGGFSVSLQEENSDLGVVVRHLQLTRMEDGATRIITQLHFCDWPDSGAPRTCASTLRLLQLSRRGKEIHREYQGLNGPVVVHCSAGIGRAGTFIAIDMLFERLVNPVLALCDSFPQTVYDTVRYLRQRRKGMIQSADQYKFIFKVVEELKSSFDSLKEASYFVETAFEPIPSIVACS